MAVYLGWQSIDMLYKKYIKKCMAIARKFNLSLQLSFQTFYLTRKGKVYPRTGHQSQEGEQGYSYTLSLTSALDGVGRHFFVPVNILRVTPTMVRT